MKADAQEEENPFELDGLVVKPGTANGKPSHKAAQPKKELFARRTERHTALLAKTKHLPASTLFDHLMFYSVRSYYRSFDLPFEYITKKTGMSRRQQLRALRCLIEVGIVKNGRVGQRGVPLIVIPLTTKTNRGST